MPFTVAKIDKTKVVNILEKIFNDAKQKDEFEYATTLLRVRGMESAGWDPFQETWSLFNDLLGLLNAPLEVYTKVRLGLLLYSHLTEVDSVYKILENMLRTVDGDRYSMDPFYDMNKIKKSTKLIKIKASPKEIVKHIQEHADTLHYIDLKDTLDMVFNEEIRNAFFHAEYTLFEDEFRYYPSMGANGGFVASSVKIAQLDVLFNNLSLFFQLVVGKWQEHIKSYDADKTVQGRLQGGQYIPVILKANKEHGLYGFESKTIPDEEIKS